MNPDLEQVQEVSGDEPADARTVVAAEEQSFVRAQAQEALAQLAQNRAERKKYATRIFVLVVFWLAVIVALLFCEGFVGPHDGFELSEAVLIAVATTTTASVTAILVVVARYLFPNA